ncbi:D-glycero-alpha-D-manno-heptose 7-phosphate kinase (EC [Olavius algarvensis Delta 1 endosymbiont]|nr:D-glycero-alpha-D-manno-heptose 7-phosphate kinase (EC [Olavius algarvensis Delta 1 endosymbiont]
MIISKTPYRVSFFGGGTDYPAWYLKEGGAVLSTTIDKYCYITCRFLPPFFATKYRIVWSYIENVSSVCEILHPAVREGIKHLGLDNGIGLEVQHNGDLPARAGMGSSSSFVVGLTKALSGMKNQRLTRHELALKAIELEQDVPKENVGSQDQVAAAYGGFNHIRFYPNGDIRVEPIAISNTTVAKLESRLMLFYTGTSRLSSEIAGKVIANIPHKKEVLTKMATLVDQAVSILEADDDIDEFGRLLHENWQLKRSLSSCVSNCNVENVYATAIHRGALGGKLLGAGSSGFILFYVPPDKKPAVQEALSPILHVPFRFEKDGCEIIYSNDKE